MSDAIVVGSGPNGLTCAVTLARAGFGVTVLEAEDTIGGGTRSSELTVPGLIHDECSAVHPMAIGSPALRALGLERHGLEWVFPDVDLAHPLDDGSAGVLMRSIDETAAGLGADGAAWQRVFGRSAKGFESLNDDLLRPFLHVPRHPLKLVTFGLAALTPATVLARAFGTPQGKALFGGVAAHSFAPLTQPMSSAVGVALISACHAFGWGVARGGSQSIANALVAELAEHGGKIETSVRVTALSDVQADVVALDLSPSGIADMAGDRLPSGVARTYRSYKYGPAAYKVDLAVEGGIPWTNEPCRRAGTVHVGGSFEELVQIERENNAGRMPARPFILVAQQYLADPGRSEGDVHPVWAYAHVPHGYDGNAEHLIIDQLERFAPGLRERIVATHVRTPAELQAHNANYIGGDIVTGANTPKQVLIRPRLSLSPYSTGIPGVYICSAASPPGGGVHGMCGYNAARVALKDLGRR